MPVFSVFNVFPGFGLWQFDYDVANFVLCVCVCWWHLAWSSLRFFNLRVNVLNQIRNSLFIMSSNTACASFSLL